MLRPSINKMYARGTKSIKKVTVVAHKHPGGFLMAMGYQLRLEKGMSLVGNMMGKAFPAEDGV